MIARPKPKTKSSRLLERNSENDSHYQHHGYTSITSFNNVSMANSVGCLNLNAVAI